MMTMFLGSGHDIFSTQLALVFIFIYWTVYLLIERAYVYIPFIPYLYVAHLPQANRNAFAMIASQQ